MSIDYHYPIEVNEVQVAMPSRKSVTIVDFSDLELGSIITYIPFTGKERICWDCGRERYLEIITDLFGKHLVWGDICHPFDDN